MCQPLFLFFFLAHLLHALLHRCSMAPKSKHPMRDDKIAGIGKAPQLPRPRRRCHYWPRANRCHAPSLALCCCILLTSAASCNLRSQLPIHWRSRWRTVASSRRTCPSRRITNGLASSLSSYAVLVTQSISFTIAFSNCYACKCTTSLPTLACTSCALLISVSASSTSSFTFTCGGSGSKLNTRPTWTRLVSVEGLSYVSSLDLGTMKVAFLGIIRSATEPMLLSK